MTWRSNRKSFLGLWLRLAVSVSFGDLVEAFSATGGATLPDSPSPFALGFAWAYRILAVSAEMVLPGVLGNWLDGQLGTQFLALVGFGVGVVVGIWHLVLMTRGGVRQLGEKDRSPERKADEQRQ